MQKHKKEIADLHDQLKKRQAAFALGEKDMKQREQEMAGRLSTARARLDEVREAAAKTKEEQLAAVLAESQVVSGFECKQSMVARVGETYKPRSPCDQYAPTAPAT